MCLSICNVGKKLMRAYVYCFIYSRLKIKLVFVFVFCIVLYVAENCSLIIKQKSLAHWLLQTTYVIQILPGSNRLLGLFTITYCISNYVLDFN